MIVVDTNLLVRLVMGGDEGADASRLLERDDEWAAPSTLPSELRNALLGYVRRGAITLDQAKAMDDDATAVLEGRIFDTPGPGVLDTAMECALTAYDAEFVTLARVLGVRLVTMNQAILRGAPEVASPLDPFEP